MGTKINVADRDQIYISAHVPKSSPAALLESYGFNYEKLNIKYKWESVEMNPIYKKWLIITSSDHLKLTW